MSDIFALFAKLEKERSGPSGLTPQKKPEYLVVGLGNPGRDYERTRHNAGFMALSVLADRCGVRCDKAKFHALVAQTEIAGHGVLLMMPQTYMNSSGEAVREAAAFYKIPPERIIVLVDDICLDVGRIRVRASGSAGGHNGLKSIIFQLNSDAFPRVRIGVGAKPIAGMPLMDWVLSRFSDADLDRLAGVFPVAAEGAELLVGGKTDEAIRRCNSYGTSGAAR